MSTPTHTSELVADRTNRRKHTPRNLEMITDALEHTGAARSIVIDEDNIVLAGNGVLAAAAGAGITKVHVVDADGQTLIAVRRTGLSDEQKRALAMFDNRTAELAEWDIGQLIADAGAGLDMTPFFFDDELTKMGVLPKEDMSGPAVTTGQAGVIVLCKDEAEQQTVYEDLTARGFTCKVVNT